MFRNHIKNVIDSILERFSDAYGVDFHCEPSGGRFLDIHINGEKSGTYDMDGNRLTTVKLPLGEKVAEKLHDTLEDRFRALKDIDRASPLAKSTVYRQMLGFPCTRDFWDEYGKRGEEPGLQAIGEDMDKPRVFVDMDGVVAKWRTDATMEEVFSEGYFRKLEPDMDAIALAERLMEEGFDVYILSKAVSTAVAEKYGWLEEYMPFMPFDHIIFVPLEAEKEYFIPSFNEKDILIDDYNKNLYGFHGIPVKYLNGINSHNRDFLCVSGGDIPYQVELISMAYVIKESEKEGYEK